MKEVIEWIFKGTDQLSPELSRINKNLNQVDSNLKRSGLGKNMFQGATRSASGFGQALDRAGSRAGSFSQSLGMGVRNIDASSLSIDRLTAGTSNLSQLLGGAGNSGGSLSRFSGALGKIPPQLMAVGAALGATVGVLASATNQAGEFSHEFRQLSNMNLDKTRAEISGLQTDVLDTAYDTGRAADVMSQAFFDVQSITGKYGKEVEDVTRKVDTFSDAFIVDFNQMSTTSSQWMKIFGKSADDLDQFFEDTIKTVQVGKTTVEELNQVRSEYMDIVAGRGMSSTSGDKLFAVFSTGAKSVDIAATQVKSAFEGLTDQRIVSELAEVGVNVFDPMTGKINELDTIVQQMVKSFSSDKLSDAGFAKIASTIGGPEGLQQLLSKARGSGEDFLATLRAFDNTDVNMDEAIARSREDMQLMSEELKGKFSVGMTKLGLQIMPKVNKALEWSNDVMRALGGETEGVSESAQTMASILSTLGQAAQMLGAMVQGVFETVGAAVKGIGNLISGMASSVRGILEDIGLVDKKISEATQDRFNTGTSAYVGKRTEQILKQVGGQTNTTAEEILAKIEETATGEQGQLLRAFTSSITGRRSTLDAISKQMRGFTLEDSAGLAAKAKAGTDMTASGKTNAVTAALSSGGSASSGSAGGASVSVPQVAPGRAVKHITVNINRLVETINIAAQTLGESAAEMTDIVQRELIKMVRDSEISLAEGE